MNTNIDDVLAVADGTPQPTRQEDTQATPIRWMQAEEPTMWPHIAEIILNHIANQKRSLQREIGPSELGTPCLRCLGRKLIHPASSITLEDPATKWMPFIGTSVHAQLERVFDQLDGYEAEQSVYVGQIGENRSIYGSIDLWDATNRATIDWKVVGNSTLEHARRHGPSQQYLIQASLYGLGKMREADETGKPDLMPQRSCIYYLPRNAPSLFAGYPFETRFDPYPGLWALDRARIIIALHGRIQAEQGDQCAEAWLDLLPADPHECFHCRETAQKPQNTDFASLAGTRQSPNPDDQRRRENLNALPQRVRDLLDLVPSHYTPFRPRVINGTANTIENN